MWPNIICKYLFINSAMQSHLKHERCRNKNVTQLYSMTGMFPLFGCLTLHIILFVLNVNYKFSHMYWVSTAARAAYLQHSIVGHDKHVLTLLLCPREINLMVTSKVETHSFIL